LGTSGEKNCLFHGQGYKKTAPDFLSGAVRFLKLLFSYQQRHGFHVVGPAEHIYRLGFHRFETMGRQIGQVPGQGGRITGYIHDALGFDLGYGR
jgi:hypothetical protein